VNTVVHVLSRTRTTGVPLLFCAQHHTVLVPASQL
jgi:hypothetical protein